MSDGWFYEGAGIYRHVWLVKTAPVHVRQWGTFVRTVVRPAKPLSPSGRRWITTARRRATSRVISTILDPAGKVVGKAGSAALSIPELGEHTYEQQVVVKQPALWSLEERNLYKLVTEIEAGGAIVDRCETTLRHSHLRLRCG